MERGAPRQHHPPAFTRRVRRNLDRFRGSRLYQRYLRPDGRVVMQRTANPRTAVRFRFRPPPISILRARVTSAHRIPISLPPLFPPFVAHRGAAVSTDALAGGDIEIPAALTTAVASRRAEFVAGRLCAREALAALGAPSTRVPRGIDGAPEWPTGFVGSISHTAELAFAAVAPAAEARGLGLDVERTS